jgi:protein associated with RNAse G/E
VAFTGRRQKGDPRLSTRSIDVEKCKLDGSVASKGEGLLVAKTDRCVVWIAPAGRAGKSPVARGATDSRAPALWLAPRGQPWVICAPLRQQGTIERVTVHSALPVDVGRSRVRWVDLDLDLEIESSLAVSLRDVDDFVRRATEFSYSDEVIETAWSGIADVTRRLIRRAWPFDGTLDELVRLACDRALVPTP